MSVKERRAAVLGHPISHSLSPVIHLTAYEILGLPWTYERVDLTADQLSSWITSRDSAWVGASLTMPLKTEVLGLLDDVDQLVTYTGAANTVIFDGDLRRGYNTDVHGIVAAITDVESIISPRVLIIGGGATARSAVAASAELGASSVDVLARRPEACADLVATGDAVGVIPTILSWVSSDVNLDYDVVMSTVPAGVADSLLAVVPAEPGILLDVVYQSWPTALARAWQAHGGRAASGLEMLLHQGVAQVGLMTGQKVAAEQIRPTLLAAAGLSPSD
jgi:shikimate dehydrogenase